jgi:hypothetical protein
VTVAFVTALPDGSLTVTCSSPVATACPNALAAIASVNIPIPMILLVSFIYLSC